MNSHIQLSEWDSPYFWEAPFTKPEYRKLAERVNASRCLSVEEIGSGIKITPNSYVGKVNLGDFQVSVKPKIEGMPLVNLFSYAYDISDVKKYNNALYDVKEMSFLDVLIYMLNAKVEELLKNGIVKDYVLHEHDLQLVRGRIDIYKIAANGGLVGATLPCRYYSRDEDTLLNQTMLAGLLFAYKLTEERNLKYSVKRNCDYLSQLISTVKLKKSLVKSARRAITRLNEQYSPIVELIALIFESNGVDFEGDLEQVESFGFMFDMNLFFEKLVGRLLKNTYGEDAVVEQYRMRDIFTYNSLYDPNNRGTLTLKPDFAIRLKGATNLLDAKYIDLWNKAPSSGILYQLATYASSSHNYTSTILYPAMDEGINLQMIDINEPFGSGKKGKIILQPINLFCIAEHIKNQDVAGLKRYIGAELAPIVGV